MSKTRRAAVRMGAALAGAALAACERGGPPAPRRPEPAGAASINILYGGGGQPVQDLYDRTAFKRFKERFPGSAINLDSSGNPLSKVLTLHAAGSAPDLIQGGDTWTIDVARQRLALPLDDHTRGWDARGDFVRSAWDSGFDGGKQYGLPLFVTARVVYLRNGVLRDANVASAPQTWEALVETARRSTKVEGERVQRQGFSSPANDGWWWFFWLLQTTGATLYRDGKPAFGGGEGESVLQFMKDLQAAIAPAGAEPLAGNDAANFTNGQVPHAWLHLAPFREIEPLNARDYREMVIATPPVPGNTIYRTAGGRKPPLTFVDNALLFLSTQSRFPDHAWELLKLLLEGETLLEFNNLRGRLVPRKSLFTQGHMKEEKVAQVAAVYEKHGRARFNPPDFDGVTRAINATVATAVKEQKLSAREGAAAIARELEQIAQAVGYTGTTRS